MRAVTGWDVIRPESNQRNRRQEVLTSISSFITGDSIECKPFDFAWTCPRNVVSFWEEYEKNIVRRCALWWGLQANQLGRSAKNGSGGMVPHEVDYCGVSRTFTWSLVDGTVFVQILHIFVFREGMDARAFSNLPPARNSDLANVILAWSWPTLSTDVLCLLQCSWVRYPKFGPFMHLNLKDFRFSCLSGSSPKNHSNQNANSFFLLGFAMFFNQKKHFINLGPWSMWILAWCTAVSVHRSRAKSRLLRMTLQNRRKHHVQMRRLVSRKG